MTTPEVHLGFNLGRPLETLLTIVGSGIAGTLVGGPISCISAIGTGYYIINKRWENAEDHAHKKRLEIDSNEIKETTAKTSWLSCRLIAYVSIITSSVILYCHFDLNKKTFCIPDVSSFDCSKYSCLNAISIISALTFSVIGLFDYCTS